MLANLKQPSHSVTYRRLRWSHIPDIRRRTRNLTIRVRSKVALLPGPALCDTGKLRTALDAARPVVLVHPGLAVYLLKLFNTKRIIFFVIFAI